MIEWTHTDRFETTATADCCGLRLRVVASFSTGDAHAIAMAFAQHPGAPEIEIAHGIADESLDDALAAACTAAIGYANSHAGAV